MDRRLFIKDAALAGLGTAVAGSLVSCSRGQGESNQETTAHEPQSKGAEPAAKGLFSVASGKDPAGITEAAVNALGGMGKFVSPGDVVVIKPNIGWDRRPEQAANTNPEVVACLVRECVKAQAKKVIVTDNTCNDPRRCFRHSGIDEVVEAAGGVVRIPETRRFKEMDVGGVLVKNWPVDPLFLEADVRINVPIAKHHGASGLTLGMKNWYGAIGGNRGRLHQDIHQSIVDLAAFFNPDLVVLDAYRILLRNGPQGGNLKDVKMVGIVAASTDQVSIDAFAATLFGLDPSELRYIVMAEKAGLGTADFASHDLKKIDLDEKAS
ncbi:DUF362 domain-containing protein [Acidobacteriota bacterium]